MLPLTLQCTLFPEDVYHWTNWAVLSDPSETGTPTPGAAQPHSKVVLKARANTFKYAAYAALIAVATGVARALWSDSVSIFIPVFFTAIAVLLLWLRSVVGRAPKHWSQLSPAVQQCLADDPVLVDQLRPCTLVLDQTGITETSPGIVHHADWSAIRSVRRFPGATALQFTARQAFVIPTRILPPGITAVDLAEHLSALVAAAKTPASVR